MNEVEVCEGEEDTRACVKFWLHSDEDVGAFALSKNLMQ